jgi:hypothetical protein
VQTCSTLLMLAMSPKTTAANMDMLSNFRSRFCTNCCNCWWAVSKF